MSHPVALGLAIFCVCLTALAQILLKAGMNAPVIQQAMDNGLLNVYWLALGSPMIWGGMICFGASAGLWLLVLTRLEVSTAYPLTSLGLVLTAVAGVYLLGESVSVSKVLGMVLVVAGVLVLSIRS